MIIQDTVELTIGINNVSYWRNKGYDIPKVGAGKNGKNVHYIIKVKISELPPKAGVKVLYRCDNCGIEKMSQYGNLNKGREKHLCFNCSQKVKLEYMNSEEMLQSRIYPTGDKHHNWNSDIKYRRAIYHYDKKVRKITEENYTKYKHILNPDNLPRTRCGIKGGYQLDHKISVKSGFIQGIEPKIIGSLDNLQLLSWQDNLKKGV
jgi:hypothetical protein